MFEIKGKYSSAKVMIDNVEEQCVAQINNFVNHPAFTNPIAIMPDTHVGKGSVIGFTMPMTEKIIPNVIGVDISCGVLMVNIGKGLKLPLDEIDKKIRNRIPFGMNTHEESIIHMKKDFPWSDVNALAHKFALAYNEKFGINIYDYRPTYDFGWFESFCERIGMNMRRAINSIGTVGGGNHAIELGKSINDENYWFMIHTGSRNLGKKVCEYWQNTGLRIIRKSKQDELQKTIANIRSQYTGMEIKNQIRKAREVIGLDVKVSDELQYLEGEYAYGYLFDMIFCQKYSEINRAKISETILNILGANEIDKIETIHNFIDFHDFIIRKGAIRSYEGERICIPLNMRDGVLICKGKSNPEFNYSAPHGAGRVMSRSQAKKTLDLENFKNQMSNIYSTSVGNGTLDEAPDAYKDAKIIEEAIGPTATIINRIIPVMNMKDGEGQEKDA